MRIQVWCEKAFNSLYRVMAYVIRFIKQCRRQFEACGVYVSSFEMNNAELVWIKSVHLVRLVEKFNILHLQPHPVQF